MSHCEDDGIAFCGVARMSPVRAGISRIALSGALEMETYEREGCH